MTILNSCAHDGSKLNVVTLMTDQNICLCSFGTLLFVHQSYLMIIAILWYFFLFIHSLCIKLSSPFYAGSTYPATCLVIVNVDTFSILLNSFIVLSLIALLEQDVKSLIVPLFLWIDVS